MCIEPLFVVDFEVGGRFCAQESLVFELVEEVVFEAEQCLLGVLASEDLLASFLLVFHIEILLQPASLCFLKLSLLFGLQPLGHHQLCVALFLVLVEVVLALLPLLLFLQLVDGAHY